MNKTMYWIDPAKQPLESGESPNTCRFLGWGK